MPSSPSADPHTADPHTAHDPLVSVVIPTFNQASYLRQAIDSVLGQTWANRECIVVDDGSTDGTPEIIASYGDRIVALRQANRGAANALNAGIRAARGELICWLSSDDAYLPEKLERQVAALLARPDAGLCCTGWETMDATGRTLKQHLESTWIHPDQVVSIFWRNAINGTTVMIPRHVFEAVGPFDETLRADVDGDMWLRVAAHWPIVSVAGILARYRVHDAAMSRDTTLMHASKTRVRKARIDDGSLVARVRAADGPAAAAVLARIGSDLLRQGLPDLARALLIRSFRSGLAPADQGPLLRAIVVGALPNGVRRLPGRLRRLPRAARGAVARIPGVRRLARSVRARH
jgi:glycosyltransferase involved in cell wall biosynthesis